MSSASPALPESQPILLTVAAVARRLGVAPSTLRTWDRRYGLGPSEHAAGEHRKYSQADISRLVYMHKLVISGVPPVDAARMAAAHDEVAPESTPAPIPYVDGQLVNSLLRAAHRMDRGSIEREIRSQINTVGVAFAWTNVLVPLLLAIGETWEREGTGIASEHMVSDVIKNILSEQTIVSNPRNQVPVLIACVGDEWHSLAIKALAATLAADNIQVQFLGANTPIEAIVEVVTRCAPPAVFLWAQVPKHTCVETLAALPAVRPAPRVILGGPGWASAEYDGAYRAKDLESACREISQALGL